MIKKVRMRTLLIGGIMSLFFVALVVRLYWIQVVDAEFLLGEAQKNWSANHVIPAIRGTIFDRNGVILANDAPSNTVAVNPQLIDDLGLTNQVATELSAILGKPYDKMMAAVSKKRENGTFFKQVEIRPEGWKIDAATSDKVNAYLLKLQKQVKQATKSNADAEKLNVGIYLLEEKKRYYPKERMASQLLGYTTKEGVPAIGLESYWDDQLKGTPGLIDYEKDLRGYKLPDSKVNFQPAKDGNNITLTIDENIQHFLEDAMKKTFDKYKPKTMTAIAVDPRTMEVLALANLPDYDANKYWKYSDQTDFFNHAIGSVYEPGSTFKVVTLAGAVEEGIFDPDKTYMSGRIHVPGAWISDWNYNGWGEITYLDGLKRSSNVGFVKLGYEGLGPDKLREYILKFGFGEKTGIELPGEAKGSVGMHYESEYATATYGQGKIQVTAMQQVAAYAAIANGGLLMEPHIIKKITDPATGKIIQETKPKTVRRVVSEDTAAKVRLYLEQVVADQKKGTGRSGYIEGYRIAGKTGTAQVVENGEYAKLKWVISFVGFAPVENPELLIAIIADRPELEGDFHEGSNVWSPIFKETMLKSLRYLGIRSSRTTEIAQKKEAVVVPDLIDLAVDRAKDEMASRKMSFIVLGKGSKIIAQSPAPGTESGVEQHVYLLTESKDKIGVPSLVGKSLRDAVEMCTLLTLQCKVTGEGYVYAQKTEKSNGTTIVKLGLKAISGSGSSGAEGTTGAASGGALSEPDTE